MSVSPNASNAYFVRKSDGVRIAIPTSSLENARLLSTAVWARNLNTGKNFWTTLRALNTRYVRDRAS